jgi:iron complex outermembrane receptor protein
VLLALGGAVMATSMPVLSQETQRIEVTGSRIKRVDAEGALPITTITREELEASGSTTVAEFMRTVTFASAGNFRPQSGSSAQSFAGVDLRGLGSARTLVLIDGRRLPKAPNVGDSVDLNSVPMAAIEKVEILTDGASAVYGSDAIGGVVNFITRKDFEGVQLTVGYTDPDSKGGSKEEVSGTFGLVSDKGRIIAGFSHTARGMVYTRQRPWGQGKGNSTYGNNYQIIGSGGTPSVHRNPDGTPIQVPGRVPSGQVDANGDPILVPGLVNFNSPIALPGACGDENFSIVPATIAPNASLGFTGLTYNVCRFDFNKVAADEASTDNQSVFVRGEYRINDDWSVYSNASFSRLGSFGRYAPVPGNVTIQAGAANNPTTGTANEEDVYLWHRFASGGNRDGFVESTVANAQVGFQGRVANMFDVDVGVAFTRSKYLELGRGYIVASAAEAAINADPSDPLFYDIYNPSANDASVLQAFTATITRDGLWNQKEAYATVGFDLMKLGGGTAQMLVGAEWRKEDYADIYDSLSEAGQILGSAGNSAGGDRRVSSLLAEAIFPITKTFEAQLAARYESYSDYGSDFSPKASFRWKLLPTLALRGSVGTGFRAPSLPLITQKTSFSAESVFDATSCAILVADPDEDCQINAYYKANPALTSEKSKQFSFGVVFDPLPWLSVKADYWNIKIDDTIVSITAQDIIDRDNGDDPRPIPAGLGITRNAGSGLIERVDAGYANEGTLKTSGLDLNMITRFNLGAWGKLSQNYTYSQVFEYKSDGDELIGDVGSPKARAMLGHTWSMGPFEVNWNINYIGKQSESATRNVGSYITHDIQASWDTPLKGGTLVLGVLNVGDKMPQLVSFDGRNFNFYLYDSYGVQPYVRFTQKF